MGELNPPAHAPQLFCSAMINYETRTSRTNLSTVSALPCLVDARGHGEGWRCNLHHQISHFLQEILGQGLPLAAVQHPVLVRIESGPGLLQVADVALHVRLRDVVLHLLQDGVWPLRREILGTTNGVLGWNAGEPSCRISKMDLGSAVRLENYPPPPPTSGPNPSPKTATAGGFVGLFEDIFNPEYMAHASSQKALKRAILGLKRGQKGG